MWRKLHISAIPQLHNPTIPYGRYARPRNAAACRAAFRRWDAAPQDKSTPTVCKNRSVTTSLALRDPKPLFTANVWRLSVAEHKAKR